MGKVEEALENVFGVSSGAPWERRLRGATRREEEYKERSQTVRKNRRKERGKKKKVEKSPTRSTEGYKRFQKVPREGPKV